MEKGEKTGLKRKIERRSRPSLVKVDGGENHAS